MAACLVASFITSPAVAQDDPGARAAARALFNEGVECSDHEDWTCAVDRFQRAYALRASPVIASNLGQALVHVGRLVEGAEMLGEVVRSSAITEEVRADARATLAEIQPQLGRLTVHVTGPTLELELTLDGRAFPESLIAVATPSDPGDHTLVAHRDGREVASAQLHVDPGSDAEVELTVPELPALTLADASDGISQLDITTPVPLQRAPEIYEEWWFWTVIGVVAAGAIGTTVGVLAAPGPALPAGSLGTIDGR